jgi:hypothetical protein
VIVDLLFNDDDWEMAYPSTRVTPGRRFEGRRLGLEIAYSFAILNPVHPYEIGRIRGLGSCAIIDRRIII